MAQFRKTDVEFHSDRSRGQHAAVNVKHYGPYLGNKVVEYFSCSEQVAEQALGYTFEMAQQSFWEQAEEWVKELWGPTAKVFSEGRSGGWLVPSFPRQGFTEEDVQGWDALALSKWAKLVKWCKQEIDARSSWESVKEDIETNEWAKDGAERYNFLQLNDGRIVTMQELKNAHQPPA
jgi:hypothetical protein